MSSLCPRCLQTAETNSHIYCCVNQDALTQRKSDWRETWQQLHKSKTATIIEQTWRRFLQPIVAIPLGESIVDTFPVVHGPVEELLQRAIDEQSTIGWDKLLAGIGTTLWMRLQDFIDAENPNPPQRTASDWMNSASRQLLKFSLRCWKARNQAIHGATRSEQQQVALQDARDKIILIYHNPPELDSRYRSIFEVPLEHRLKMPLNAAEHWIALIQHRVKTTAHNLKLLLSQHKPMQAHLRTMRRKARQQAKDRNLPNTPRKAHSRAVQEAVRAMKTKLYSSKRGTSKHPATNRKSNTGSQLRPRRKSFAGLKRQQPRLRPHPP